MERILSAILILFLLSSQTAMAFNSIKLTPGHHYLESSQNIPSDHDSHDGDHSCHSAAHFVGLASSIPVYQPVMESNPDFQAQFTFISQPRHPPTPPPVV